MESSKGYQFSKSSHFSPKLITVILLIPFVCNIDLIFYQFAWSDDFAIRADSLNSGGEETFLTITANLRPLFALFLKLAFSRIIFENDVLFLRLFSLIGMCLLNLILFKLLRDRAFSQKFSLFLIFITNCLPSFQQYTHFATSSIFTWVCAASTLAYYLISKSRFKNMLWPLLFISIGTIIYPPAALFGLALLSIDLAHEINLGKSMYSPTFKRIVQKTFLIYGIGSLSGLVFAYTYGHFIGVQFAERTKLITSFSLLIEKFHWALSHLFITEIRPLAIGAGDNKIIALQVLPALLLLTHAVTTTRGAKPRLSILSLLIFPLISSLPNLVVAENQFEFRTLPGLCFGGIFIYLFLLVSQFSRVRSRFSVKVTNSIVILALSIILINSEWNAYELWVAPGKLREKVITNQISNLTKNVCIYLPEESIKPLARLGIYSMRTDLQSSWVTNNLFVFIPSVSRDTQIFVIREKESCAAGNLIIDFSQLGNMSYRKYIW